MRSLFCLSIATFIQKINLLIVVLACLCLPIFPSSAENMFWVGGDGGSWNDPNNWFPTRLPSSSDDVFYYSPEVRLTINILAESYANSIQCSGTLAIRDGGSLSVYSDSDVNGIIIENGDLIINGGSFITTIPGPVPYTGNIIINDGSFVATLPTPIPEPAYFLNQGNVIINNGSLVADMPLPPPDYRQTSGVTNLNCGFNNLFRQEYHVLNIESLNRFDDDTTVTSELLKNSGINK